MIDLCLLIWTTKFLWEWACPILGRDKWKIGTKLENAQFPRALKGNFYYLFLNGKSMPHSTILTPNTLSDFKIEPKTKKNYVFEKILKHSFNFEPLPPPISGINPKFDYATLCVLHRSLASHNFVFKSYFYKSYRGNLWGVGSNPPPPPPP